jgi:hypothetical protein
MGQDAEIQYYELLQLLSQWLSDEVVSISETICLQIK